MTDITWTNDTRRLADLVPWENNPKRMSTKAGEGLHISLDKFGYALPMLIGPNNDLYDGHQRLPLLRSMVKKYGPNATVDVRVSSRPLTDDERRELVVRLKQNQAGWDFDMLPNLYEREELIEWGFEPAELGMFEDEPQGDDPGPQIDRAEELREKWQVELGQLWLLDSGNGNPHRLICGDCTDAAVVARVMGGEIANLALTDPPYNVGFDYGGEVNDSKTTDEYEQWSLSWFDAACGVSEKITFTPGGVNLAMWLALMDVTAIGAWIKSGNTGGAHGAISMFQCWEPIVFCVNKQFQHKRKYEFTDWLRASGVTSRQIDEATNSNMGGHYLTIKSQPAIPTARMWHKIKHLFEDVPSRISELIENRIDDGFGRLRHTDVFDYSPTDGVDTRHVCPKPTSLWEDIIRNYSEVGGAVYDPFLGSGTTLIACERLGRRCRAVEISPAYCGVAIERWHQMTGREPVLISEKSE